MDSNIINSLSVLLPLLINTNKHQKLIYSIINNIDDIDKTKIFERIESKYSFEIEKITSQFKDLNEDAVRGKPSIEMLKRTRGSSTNLRKSSEQELKELKSSRPISSPSSDLRMAHKQASSKEDLIIPIERENLNRRSSSDLRRSINQSRNSNLRQRNLSSINRVQYSVGEGKLKPPTKSFTKKDDYILAELEENSEDTIVTDDISIKLLSENKNKASIIEVTTNKNFRDISHEITSILYKYEKRLKDGDIILYNGLNEFSYIVIGLTDRITLFKGGDNYLPSEAYNVLMNHPQFYKDIKAEYIKIPIGAKVKMTLTPTSPLYDNTFNDFVTSKDNIMMTLKPFNININTVTIIYNGRTNTFNDHLLYLI